MGLGNGKVQSVLRDMIADRQQVVIFNSTASSPIYPSSGVIQGGISSPLLFNIYSNVIGDKCKSKCFKFADDNSLLLRARKNEDDIKDLQMDINYLTTG